MDYIKPQRKLKSLVEADINFDLPLVLVLLAMLGFGFVMVASASIPVAERLSLEPSYFVFRQGIFLLIGILIGMFVFRTPTDVWQKWAPLLLFLGVLLLVLVLIPGVGKVINGSRRWISLGFFNIQASEFAKLFLYIYLADYLLRHGEQARNELMGFVRPMIIVMLMCLLLIAEPDFGATVVLLTTSLTIMFLSGIRFKYIASTFIALGLLVTLLAVVKPYLQDKTPYVFDRVSVLLNPWGDPFDKGYQATNSLMAFGRGGIDGVGLGGSIQKLHYLPEPHNDYIFSIIGEELGLIGATLVMLMFVVLVWRAFSIATKAINRESYFSAYLAYGIATWIAMQAMINMGVSMVILPAKGLNLPLISYGGSNLIVTLIAIAMLLRIDYENRHDKTNKPNYVRKR